MVTKRQCCYCLYAIVLVFIFVATLNLVIIKLFPTELEKTMVEKLIRVDFEVFGKVQGVFFRKHTQTKGAALNLVGWCKNTSNDTVKGILEGEESKVNEMKDWLQNVGSPQSKIEKAIFNNEKQIDKLTFTKFDIKR